MNIKCYIDRTLANGRGSQLIFVSVIIAVAFFSLWLLSTLLFGGDSFGWQDIIALFLDPGVFGGAGEHDWFRLIVTLVGVVLVAAMLISVFSNIFENISASYTKGEIRYKFKNQILIIGANENLLGLLEYIRNAEIDYSEKRFCLKHKLKKFEKRQIVVMTTRPIEVLRDEVEAFFNDSMFTNRILFYLDRRDNFENLKRAGVEHASSIYILGEGGEENHDMISLTCVKYVRDILKNKKGSENVECLAIINSQTTMRAYQKYLSLDNESYLYKIPYTENIININECRAELVLSRTFVDYVKKLDVSDAKDINVVILGMSSLGRALATTLSYACHFKNKRHTIITIVDEDIENKVHEFKSRYHTLFRYCPSEYSKDFKSESDTSCDLNWRFIDARVSTQAFIDEIEKMNHESHLFIYACHENYHKNLAIEVSLRNQVDDLRVFSDFGRYDDAFTIYSSSKDDGPFESFKGIFAGLTIAEQNNYIFNLRQQCAKKRFEDAHPGRTWKTLTFADKIRRVYETVVDDWWGKECNMVGCTNYILYLVYGQDKDRLLNFANMVSVTDDHTGLLDVRYAVIKCLNDDIEAGLCVFLRKLRSCHESVYFLSDYWASSDFMDAIMYCARSKGLSDESIDELFEITRYHDSDLEPNGILNNYCEYEVAENQIRERAADIICQLSFNGNSRAKMWKCVLNYLEFGAVAVKELQAVLTDKNLSLPKRFAQLLGLEEMIELYSETKDDRIMDWIICFFCDDLHSKSNFDAFERSVRVCEHKVQAILNLKNQGDLYLRMSGSEYIDNSLKGMWLLKAAGYYFVEKDDNNLKNVFAKLGVYFSRIDGKADVAEQYYKELRRMPTLFPFSDDRRYFYDCKDPKGIMVDEVLVQIRHLGLRQAAGKCSDIHGENKPEGFGEFDKKDYEKILSEWLRVYPNVPYFKALESPELNDSFEEFGILYETLGSCGTGTNPLLTPFRPQDDIG